jgi:hypothetical protein
VLSAINLDNEPMLLAYEIDNERADGYLAPKAEPIKAMRAQCGPQAPLGVSHVSAQRFREMAFFRRDMAVRS